MTTIIEIEPLENGAHRNQTLTELRVLPDGWAVIPDDLLPMWDEHGPFVTVTVTDGQIIEMEPGEWPSDDTEPLPDPTDPLEQRIADLEDAVVELAAIIAGGEG